MEQFQGLGLPLGGIIGLNRFCLDEYRCVTSLVILRLVGDRPRDIA